RARRRCRARSAMRRSWAVRSSPTTMQSAQRDEK
ncbi:YbjN domain-containing protein, partial [Mycobacterium tuberculosis]